MNSYDLDSLRLLTRERHQQRLREAEAERLIREIRTTREHPQRRTVGLALAAGRHLLGRPRLEI